MTDYKCPNCMGGFPSEALDDDRCPWCGLELGEAESFHHKSVTRVLEDKEDDDDKGLLGIFR